MLNTQQLPLTREIWWGLDNYLRFHLSIQTFEPSQNGPETCVTAVLVRHTAVHWMEANREYRTNIIYGVCIGLQLWLMGKNLSTLLITLYSIIIKNHFYIQNQKNPTTIKHGLFKFKDLHRLKQWLFKIRCTSFLSFFMNKGLWKVFFLCYYSVVLSYLFLTTPISEIQSLVFCGFMGELLED